MNTIFPICRNKFSKNKWVTYRRIVCDIRLQKVETYWLRLTAEDNLIIYNGTTSILTATIPIFKTHWNSVISTLKAKYLTLDIKDFYLNSKLSMFKYLRLLYKLFQWELIDLHNLDDFITENKYVY